MSKSAYTIRLQNDETEFPSINANRRNVKTMMVNAINKAINEELQWEVVEFATLGHCFDVALINGVVFADVLIEDSVPMEKYTSFFYYSGQIYAN